HMEHYGRHGSRWFSHPIKYEKAMAQLAKAHKANKLTDEGIKLLNTIRFIADTTSLRVGDLTPLGHRQHRGIARRMVTNFPEIFRPGAYVNGVSTIIVRCIMSMNNELQQIESMVPDINMTFDASKSTWSLLNSTITDSVSMAIFSNASKTTLQDFGRTYCSDISYFTSRTFNDPQWAMDSLDMRNLAIDIAKIVISAPNYDNLYDISDAMSVDELRREDGYRRVYWYLKSGNAPQTFGRMPYANRHLLANIIQSADTAITSTNPGANMRFGHDTVLMPLLVLMEIDGAHLNSTSDLTHIARTWDAGHYLPMACNLQLVFYRPTGGKKGDILLKALLNEHEVTLPGKPKSFPYYRWSD
ncbi:MAG: histidine phosphatase family protein, partial [Muribaculaceae bacterium]|nr:histidine phosphatase family protein [Muribaculaceae bacterium]